MRDSRFPCSVHLDARKIQPRCVIHDFLVACNLLHERFNPDTWFSIPSWRAFWCTKDLTSVRASWFRATSCTLRFPVSCIKMHATIYDFVHQDARYDPRFRASRCTLRFMISCNKLHAAIHDFVHQDARYDRQKSAVKNKVFFHRTLFGFNDKLSL